MQLSDRRKDQEGLGNDERVGGRYGCVRFSPHLSPSDGSRLAELSRVLRTDGGDVSVAEEVEEGWRTLDVS